METTQGPGLGRIKIVVTDSGGVDHVFNDIPGEVENYFEINEPEKGMVTIKTFTFSDGDLCDTENHAIFTAPRRVDLVFVREQEGL